MEPEEIDEVPDSMKNSVISLGFNKMDQLEKKNSVAIQDNYALQLQLFNL